MNTSAISMVPTLAVVATAGWACWSNLGAPEPSTPKGKVEAIAATLLAPDLGALGDRDPFRLPGAPVPGKAATANPWDGWMTRLSRAFARPAGTGKGADDAAKAKAKARAALEGLELGGTSIGDGRKVAILAGHAYAEGETIEGVDRSLGPVVLAEVRASEVVLDLASGPVTVRFPDASRPSPAAPVAAMVHPAAKPPARARAKSTTPTMKGRPR